MILRIKKYPDQILKEKADRVEEITEEIKALCQDMIETLGQAQGVGLAAPQVGELKRIIIVGKEAFLNPEIVKKSKETEINEEGCLCFPGIYLKIKRAKKVKVEALSLEGKKIQTEAEELSARIFQHEIDHLNGKLIIDKIPFWQRWKIKKQLK